jgi:type IV pilus assembly protein PilW
LNVVHAASGTPGNDPSSWGGASAPESERFGPGSEITRMVTRVYFIRNGVNGRPALWMRDGAAAAQELVEGVEGLRVLYGRDTDGSGVPNDYVSADAITTAAAWRQVVSARVSVLVVSDEDHLAAVPASLTFNGVSHGPDRRLRQVYTSTVALRNRLL